MSNLKLPPNLTGAQLPGPGSNSDVAAEDWHKALAFALKGLTHKPGGKHVPHPAPQTGIKTVNSDVNRGINLVHIQRQGK